MRVLHVTPTYVPAWRYGGPIRSVHGLCRGLVRLGVDVHVFTTSVDGPDDLKVPVGRPVEVDGVKVWYFRSSWLRRLYFAPAMASTLEKELATFALVHLHSVFLWPTWMAARKARARRIPYILSPRGMLVKALIERKSALVKKAWIALIERQNLERASAIHVTSDTEAQEITRLFSGLGRILPVPNGVDLEQASAQGLPPQIEAVLDEARPVVLYLGRVHWIKGLDRLIRSLTLLPEVRLLIVGNDEEGYTTQLQAVARESAVLDRVTFAGPVDIAAKAELFRRAALCAVPSYSENFGNVVLEAMAHGCPVVVTREVGAASVVKEARAGLVVDGAPEEIARGISYLIGNPAERQAMGQAGRQCVSSKYTWDSVAGEMLAHYRSLVQ